MGEESEEGKEGEEVMKITLELEDGEDGIFDTATFLIDPGCDGLFKIVCENVNQFLYPFIGGSQHNLKAMVQELTDPHGEDQIQEALSLGSWKTEKLKILRDKIDKVIGERTVTPTDPQTP
jgi:hypothetical protein